MGYKHSSHDDDLVICRKADYGEAKCAACGDTCSGMTYGCKGCTFYIHYSCLLPDVISHPAHPPHPLFLDPDSTEFICSACGRQLKDCFRFLCRESGCSFAIDVKCAAPLPAVIYPGHRHRLNFFDELPEGVELRRCGDCDEPCRSWVLCCLDCKFGVHLLCERLSLLFEHRRSRCPSKDILELKASIEEEDVPEDLPNFCLYCWDVMGPQTPLCYCKGCQFIAHVKCIFSRAVDQGDDLKMIRAEMKQDGGKEGNSEAEELAMQHVETFGYMVDSLSDKEKAELEVVRKRRVVEIIKVLAWRNDAGGSSDGGVPNSPFLDKAFSEFMKKLPHDIPRTNSLAVASEYERIVEVAEYRMTQKLTPVLRELFANHGDLSDESTLTLKPKIVVFVMLCGTIYSMANTRVVEVTEELLYNWWKYLMFIYHSGFKIQFAIDRLKVIMRAHYTDLQDDNNSILRMDKGISELSINIHELQRKLDRLNERRGEMPGAADKNLVEACLEDARAWKF